MPECKVFQISTMSLEALAEIVTAHSKELDERGVVDPAALVGFRNLSPDDLACRSRLLTAIEELRRLALGPAESLHEMMGIATCDITCLEALARYDIPSHVALDGTTPIHSLASHVPHLDEATLARLLRNCIVIGAFAEPAPGRIAHTPLSRLLRDADFAGLVRFLAEEDGAAARRTLDALEKWPRSRAPHHTGFHLANASSADETPFFEVLARDPRRVEQAARAFAAMVRMPGRAEWAALRASPLWREVGGRATVVDVGGGRGQASMCVADGTAERVRFVVQDLPATAALGRQMLPERYAGRVEFVAHDFFEEQPAREGRTVFFLRKILHDWPDEHCLRILRNIVPALGEGDMVVVCEYLMPERAEAGYEQRAARFADILMLQNHNAGERTESEWRELFAQADSRFVVEFEHWKSTLDGLVKATWKP